MCRLPLLATLLATACADRSPQDAGGAAIGALPEAVAPADRCVAAGEPLQAAIDAAADGATVELLPGEHRGPVRLDRGITLRGPRAAVIASDGTGSTVQLGGKGAGLLGCTVRGSGSRFDLLDSAIRVEGQDLVVRGVQVREALFGILVQLSQRVTIAGNVVLGTGQAAMGLRGDGIRLWETTDSVVADNVVRDCRDVVVWYSSGNRITGNRTSGCRYGTHFMYSHGNVVSDNRHVDDVVGIFVMYSRDVEIRRNLLARSTGAAGIGLGVKESGNLVVADNWFVQDTIGVYLDTSPLDTSHHNEFTGNVFRLCDAAVSFHASVTRNRFTDNQFADNDALLRVGGQGDALACEFRSNHYDGYRGYDLDGDGIGDVPFEYRRLSSQLEDRRPELALLHGAPALQMVDLVGELLPMFAPRMLMTDAAPRLRAQARGWQPQEDADAR
ncbi:MAG: nitrous oxide reductase family maturation protein NosD [Planctomycetota bacterium]